MQSHATVLDEQAELWQFIEIWVDPILFPPKILMLVAVDTPQPKGVGILPSTIRLALTGLHQPK